MLRIGDRVALNAMSAALTGSGGWVRWFEKRRSTLSHGIELRRIGGCDEGRIRFFRNPTLAWDAR